MSSPFADLHDELRAVARDLLGAGAGADPGADRGGAALDWPLVASSGWLGLEVPEELDGSGATFAEVAIILEEMGRAASTGPYLGTAVLGVGALQLLEPGAGRDALLREIADGTTLVALALAGDDAAIEADGDGWGPLSFRIQRDAAGPRVEGRASFVPDATEAGRLLVPAFDDGHLALVAVDPMAPEVEVEPQPVVDATRRFGVVRATGVAVGEASIWRFAADPDAAIQRLRDRAAVAVACDCLGLGEAMLDATVAYATDRQQFGRPIGSFQAVKHACADMAVQLAVARELVSDAVIQVASLDVAHDAGVAAAMAKAYAGDAAVAVAGKAMQLHGGIGYTWESGIHVFLKRAALNRSLFGASAAHRRRLAARHA